MKKPIDTYFFSANATNQRGDVSAAKQATIHDLKVWPEYLEAIECMVKNFEVRKNDRDFKVGDFLRLLEYDPFEDKYLGREEVRRITYILKGGFGLKKGFVVLGLQHDPICEIIVALKK